MEVKKILLALAMRPPVNPGGIGGTGGRACPAARLQSYLGSPAGEEAAGDLTGDAEPGGEADVEVAVGAFLVVPAGMAVREVSFDNLVKDLADRCPAVPVAGDFGGQQRFSLLGVEGASINASGQIEVAAYEVGDTFVAVELDDETADRQDVGMAVGGWVFKDAGDGLEKLPGGVGLGGHVDRSLLVLGFQFSGGEGKGRQEVGDFLAALGAELTNCYFTRRSPAVVERPAGGSMVRGGRGGS